MQLPGHEVPCLCKTPKIAPLWRRLSEHWLKLAQGAGQGKLSANRGDAALRRVTKEMHAVGDVAAVTSKPACCRAATILPLPRAGSQTLSGDRRSICPQSPVTDGPFAYNRQSRQRSLKRVGDSSV
jgi:hypothetical protein